jgi:type-F conjugative transfer system protein TraW
VNGGPHDDSGRRLLRRTRLGPAPDLAGAADLGTLGPTYGIAEPHLLNFIEQRLRDKERSGELQRLMQEAQSRGIDAVKRPQPVAGLRATEAARSFYVDPTFTLDRNIVDAQGRLLFAAGTRKNPLEVVSCRSACCSSTPGTHARSRGHAS